jgi:hypothetical protein
MKMTFRNRRAFAALLSIVLLIGAFGTLNVNAQRRSRGYYRGHHHSRTKGAVIGGVVGAVGGALIGGGTRRRDWRRRRCRVRLLDPEA